MFTFELGHLLDEGIDPSVLRVVRERCPRCGVRSELTPRDVWELV